MEFLSGLPAIEFPVDPDMMAIHAAVPCARLFAKGAKSPDPALAQALPGEQADLDLRLIQPTAMLGRVVNREAIPQPASGLVAKPFYQRLPRMRAEVVHHQVKGVGLGIAGGDPEKIIGKLGRRASRSDAGEVPARLRLHAAEHIGSATTLILIIPFGYPAGFHRYRRADILVQGDRLLIHTDHRLLLRQGLLVHRQHIFHAGDVWLIEIGHAPHFFPATAAGRGFGARPGWFLVLLSGAASVSPPRS